MTRTATALATVLLAVATPAIAEAQVVRGTVTSRLGGQLLAGVVVELKDSTLSRVAFALTGDAGAFTLRAPRPGSYSINARRIGFRPHATAPFVALADTTMALAMEAFPQALPEVTAVERALCRQRADDASATGVLWENATTAMLSSAATMRDSAYAFDYASQLREYSLGPTTLTHVDVGFERIVGARPWMSLPPDELERLGFVHLSRERQLLFVAPDLDVLIAPGFSLTHCFSVRDDDRRPRLIGLEFRPHESVRHADVRGTLWLSRDSLALESLEFSFTGLHFAGHDSLAGGQIEFERLGGDIWVPRDWYLRSPVPPSSFVDAVARRGRRVLQSGRPVPLTPADPRWDARRIIVTGGSVLALRTTGADSATLWSRPAGSLDVTINWRRGDRGPAEGARVELVGLGVTAFADSAGRASFDAVPPGDYILDSTTELQDLLRLPRERVTVRVRPGGTTRARVTALPSRNAVNTVCAFNGDAAVVAGVVKRDSITQPWVRVRLTRAEKDQGGRERFETVRTGWSDTNGRFNLCRIPRGESFVVIARYEDGTEVRKEVQVPEAARDAPVIHLVRLDFNAPKPAPFVANESTP